MALSRSLLLEQRKSKIVPRALLVQALSPSVTSSLGFFILCPRNLYDSFTDLILELFFKSLELRLERIKLLLYERWILIIEAKTIAFSVLDQSCDSSVSFLIDLNW